MDVNKEIFKKYRFESKAEIIRNFTDKELLSISVDTLLRIIKEVGYGDPKKKRNKFKTLRLKDRVGNAWNSTIEGIFNSRDGKTYLDVYVQGDDIDGNDYIEIFKFLRPISSPVICGKLHESFSNGYEHTVVARYDDSDRAKVIREILNTYNYLKNNKK